MPYVLIEFTGNDLVKNNGAIEAVSDTARNNSQAIGRLLDLMAAKGLVSAKEAATVVEGGVFGLVMFDK